MKSNKLRIGNYVEFADSVYKVNHHTFSILAREKENHKYKPIPLTEEWLLKFGCVESHKGEDFVNYWNQGKDFSIDIVDGEIFNYRLYERYRTKSITYVHQLQNLYFALTGEELTIKQTETA